MVRLVVVAHLVVRGLVLRPVALHVVVGAVVRSPR
jgi:hypothetical protein